MHTSMMWKIILFAHVLDATKRGTSLSADVPMPSVVGEMLSIPYDSQCLIVGIALKS